MIVLAWYRNSLEMKRSYWILIFSLVIMMPVMMMMMMRRMMLRMVMMMFGD